MKTEPYTQASELARAELLERQRRLERELDTIKMNIKLSDERRAEAVKHLASTVVQFTGVDEEAAKAFANDMASYANEFAEALLPLCTNMRPVTENVPWPASAGGAGASMPVRK